MNRRGIALVVPLLLFVPRVREGAEASMLRYMAGATPLLLWAGYVFAGLPGFQRFRAWNAHGVPALLVFSSVLTVWMIPNALDQATASPGLDAIRTLTHFGAGAALRLGLREASVVVQLFFVGHAVTMTIFVGVLFQSLPQRLCNVYLVDDQGRTGVALVVIATAAGTLWVWEAMQTLRRANPLPHTSPSVPPTSLPPPRVL